MDECERCGCQWSAGRFVRCPVCDDWLSPAPAPGTAPPARPLWRLLAFVAITLAYILLVFLL